MIKSHIQQVTNQLQYRAIGIVNGIYLPHDKKLFNKGFLVDNQGKKNRNSCPWQSFIVDKKTHRS